MNPKNTALLRNIGIYHVAFFQNTEDTSYLYTAMDYFEKGINLEDSDCQENYY